MSKAIKAFLFDIKEVLRITAAIVFEVGMLTYELCHWLIHKITHFVHGVLGFFGLAGGHH